MLDEMTKLIASKYVCHNFLGQEEKNYYLVHVSNFHIPIKWQVLKQFSLVKHEPRIFLNSATNILCI